MRVSIVNFCSTAVEMLDFSSKMMQENAGTKDFDYIVVTWKPTPEVLVWIKEHPEVIQVEYQTNENLGYVPNLRAMMNSGFDAGYKLNDWVCVINTDMAFGRNWLLNLVRHAKENVIPNSIHLTPIHGPHVITVDLGITTAKTFDFERFWKMHDKLYQDGILTEEKRGGWLACATFPYVLHRKWWECYGPWETDLGEHQESPDRRFFRRCHEAGARFILVLDSICYHHEAVERRGKRPPGLEHLPEGR